jgi:hypothetical protein
VERDDIEAGIRAAFEGVRLGSGVSLRQAKAIDNYSRGLTRAQFDALKQAEVTDDWTRVPEDEVAAAYVAHLDADGLRFYLPALMLWLLDHYDDEDLDWGGTGMTIIGTVIALAPPQASARSRWDVYDGFSPEQRTAIASYLEALPRLVGLLEQDATSVAESLGQYWAQFMP